MYDAAADMTSNNVDGTAWMDQISSFLLPVLLFMGMKQWVCPFCPSP